jgi:hypothetical protein
MRLVSWNCCNAFARKVSHLQALAQDVALVSEVRRVWRNDLARERCRAWIATSSPSPSRRAFAAP